MHASSRSVVLLPALLVGWAATAHAQESDKRPVPDGTVRFETGSSGITEESKRALDRIADYIQSQPVADILVVGHTDRHGGKATNLKLSKSRARKVKRELIKRKVPSGRISVMGVGGAEPISTEATKAADTVNRRVEVWVGTRDAIAWVSFVYRQVEAQKPAATSWDPAKVQMELRRLFRVRTLDQSAGEVTFAEGKTIFLGPRALVVIYGKDEKKRKTRAVADVTVEQGTLLTKLGKEPVLVDTDDARFTLRSNRTRLDASDDKERTTISVYDGAAYAYAKRKRVEIAEGYGTRVKRGEAPEEPTPLAPPPTWSNRERIVVFAGRPVSLSWTPAIDHEGALVEIGDVADPTLERPFETRFVEGRSVAVSNLQPGSYRVRLSTVDARDIVGMPGQSRELVVLPAPEAISGKLSWIGDGYSLSEPGPVRLPSARNAKTEWTNPAGEALPRQIQVGPGTTRLQVQLTNDAGAAIGEGKTKVVVRPVSVKLIEVETSVPQGELDEITFIVEVNDREGLPEDDLKLATGEPDIGVLETPVEDPTWMLPLTKSRTATTTFSSIGEGRYRVKWLGPRSAGSSARYVLVYDPQRNVGQHVLLPVVGRLEPPKMTETGEPRLKIEHGLHFALTGGIEIARDDVHPGFRAEVGWTIVALDTVRLSLGIEAGYTRASVQAGTVEMFPMKGRATVGFLAGSVVRPYFGFAGGVRFLSGSLEPGFETAELQTPKQAIEGILGLGLHFSGFEVFVEGRYGPTRMSVAPGFGNVGEPGVYGGFRFFLEKG